MPRNIYMINLRFIFERSKYAAIIVMIILNVLTAYTIII